VLRVQSNSVTSIGEKTVVKCLHSPLMELHLGCNVCGTAGVEVVVRARKLLSNLCVLGLDQNMFSTDDTLVLQEACGDVLVKIDDNVSDDDAGFNLIFGMDRS